VVLMHNLPATVLELGIGSGGKVDPLLLSMLFARVVRIQNFCISYSRHLLIADIVSLLLSPLD
jgi:hypothetical protein